MKFIKNIFKKVNNLNYKEYREAILSEEDIFKRANYAQALKNNPILDIILNQLEVATADNIAGAKLTDEKELIGLTSYLKSIRDLRVEIEALIEIANEVTKNEK